MAETLLLGHMADPFKPSSALNLLYQSYQNSLSTFETLDHMREVA